MMIMRRRWRRSRKEGRRTKRRPRRRTGKGERGGGASRQGHARPQAGLSRGQVVSAEKVVFRQQTRLGGSLRVIVALPAFPASGVTPWHRLGHLLSVPHLRRHFCLRPFPPFDSVCTARRHTNAARRVRVCVCHSDHFARRSKSRSVFLRSIPVRLSNAIHLSLSSICRFKTPAKLQTHIPAHK